VAYKICSTRGPVRQGWCAGTAGRRQRQRRQRRRPRYFSEVGCRRCASAHTKVACSSQNPYLRLTSVMQAPNPLSLACRHRLVACRLGSIRSSSSPNNASPLSSRARRRGRVQTAATESGGRSHLIYFPNGGNMPHEEIDNVEPPSRPITTWRSRHPVVLRDVFLARAHARDHVTHAPGIGWRQH
jgi:hypothetical protein